MLVSELVWEKVDFGSCYFLSQLLRREWLHNVPDHRDWRIQHCNDWNVYKNIHPDVWYVEHRVNAHHFSGATVDGFYVTCIAELGCWLTQFTPKGNSNGSSSND